MDLKTKMSGAIKIGAALFLAVLLTSRARADWQQGTYDFEDKPVTEFHCAPASAKRAPAVIILHGAGPKVQDETPWKHICENLATNGYYAEFIEYYSQTGAVDPSRLDEIKQHFPVWIGEIQAGVQQLRKNPAVEPNRIGVIGFSLGASLALSSAALEPDELRAVVEYYGWLPSRLYPMATTLPPVLILHGAQDQIVPVKLAQQLDSILSTAKRPHETKIYDRAEHGFNFQSPESEETTDAWQRSLTFLDKYLKQ
jgi:dienelactone hydrolase